jgi:hypothetical protein
MFLTGVACAGTAATPRPTKAAAWARRLQAFGLIGEFL